ncbi:FtsK/SpoIIIE domain-containing protein [Oceanobacillus chungangensis]|uniref:FtsK domain-containing protein n=1 Tax=Oceanobacillus chungangensis TaxID=1229152 RepID=A0A3D8PIM0_9BACI|nr:FtsK/SpoIIIE domain-containing protein [Oceanobacillus chungangensis]RDW15943.1 hypothetical protein CWR45_15725 [Oceanobacillus chungangensis]
MLTLIGWSMVGASVAGLSYPAFESVFLKNKYNEKKLKEILHKSFVNGKFYHENNGMKVYPTILKFETKNNRLTFVFNVPKGLSCEEFEKRSYVFKQHFGMFINLDMNERRGVLKVYPRGLHKFKYNYDDVTEDLEGKIPIVCGRSLEGDIFSFDLVKNPHVLIAGETGSGKSSAIRVILTTLIKQKNPSEIQLILGDLKRSEFHLFKRIEHVEGVYYSADTLRPVLNKVKKEMTKRGDKLDAAEVNSIDELKEKLPYIIVCIDEVVLLKKETDIMDILEEISSIGRSLGVFIILSMQRPDSKLLDGKLKVNLTVRMGFITADAINAKIIGTPGSEKLTTPGRMILKTNSSLQEIQCPLLENKKAKKLLEPFKVAKVIEPVPEQDDYNKVLELFKNE